MANPEQLAKLKEGVEAWNRWRKDNADVKVDLSNTDLRKANLRKANLRKANLREVNFSGAELYRADLFQANLSGALLYQTELSAADLRKADLSNASLSRATLSEAKLSGANLSLTNLYLANLYLADLGRADLSWAKLKDADLSWANLKGANLTRANLNGANLRGADLSGANLRWADLSETRLIDTKLKRANLTECRVYGISVWGVDLGKATQSTLVITRDKEPIIQVDSLEVAQFVYLLLNNERIRHVIDTITSKVVLILGRFTPERKAILDAIRNELRERDYLPILFDFAKPESKDLTGTVTTLANMARFIIADLTAPSSVPHELATIAPGTVVPIQAILSAGQREYSMFPDLKRRYHWVLEPYQYESEETLLANLSERVIAPAEAKVMELRKT
jgi:uncharacterized protein YjbI with pentapeptide repeats